MNKALHSSDKMDWGTPWDFFYPLDREFHFDVDVCATAVNTKVRSPKGCYITPEIDGLETPWHMMGSTAWCNPPYGRSIGKWVTKALDERMCGVTTVMLVPARTDTQWWGYFWDHETHRPACPGDEVRFIKGRIRFQGAPASAPFPSALVVLRGA